MNNPHQGVQVVTVQDGFGRVISRSTVLTAGNPVNTQVQPNIPTAPVATNNQCCSHQHENVNRPPSYESAVRQDGFQGKI